MILVLTAEHPDRDRVLGLLTDEQHAELWADGRHKIAEVPDNAVWWVALHNGAIVALGALWQEPDGTWRSGCNAELGWRDRDERWWPELHDARQTWLADHAARLGITRITTWLHDVEGAAPGTSAVVRVHLDTKWKLTGEHGTLDGGSYARQLAWRP